MEEQQNIRSIYDEIDTVVEERMEFINNYIEELFIYISFIERRTKLYMKLFYVIAAMTIIDAALAIWHIWIH